MEENVAWYVNTSALAISFPAVVVNYCSLPDILIFFLAVKGESGSKRCRILWRDVRARFTVYTRNYFQNA